MRIILNCIKSSKPAGVEAVRGGGCARASKGAPATRRQHRPARAIERFFFRHRRRLPWLHAALLVLFVAILVVPPLTPLPGAGEGVADNYRLFADLVLWGVWFPLVFLSAVFGGRAWCGLMCPMGAASEWANRKGLRRPIPAWLRWPGTPVVSFVLVTLWAQTVGARDHALSALILFGGVMAAAVAVGFLFGRDKRAWCRHACPIGLLLGVYSRLGAVEFRPKSPEPGGDRWREKGVCPTLIDLRRKTESRHCIECFRCVGPDAKGGLSLRFRRPGSEVANIRQHNPNGTEVAFLFLASGLALGGFLWLVLDSYQGLRLWVATEGFEHGQFWLGEPGPRWLMAVYPDRREVFRWIDAITIAGYMTAWMLLTAVVLAATTAAAAWLSGRTGGGGSGSFRRRFVELGYQVAPVAMVSLLLGLGGDLFHAIALLGLDAEAVRALKLALFAAGGLWSLYLGGRLLAEQGLAPRARIAPLAAATLGTLFLGAAWYPAVFGA